MPAVLLRASTSASGPSITVTMVGTLDERSLLLDLLNALIDIARVVAAHDPLEDGNLDAAVPCQLNQELIDRPRVISAHDEREWVLWMPPNCCHTG